MINCTDLTKRSEMEKWDDYVLSHPGGTPFHSAAWIRTLSESYGFPQYLFSLRSGERISGVLPFLLVKGLMGRIRFVSLPYSDYGGPLCSSDTECQELLLLTSNWIAKGTNVEIRGALQEQIGESIGLTKSTAYVRHVLRLDKSPLVLMANLEARTIRYGIRKALREGITVREDNSLNGLEEFYRLNRMTRRRHGVLAQPISFFKNIYRNIIESKLGFILVAYDCNVAVASGIFLKFGDVLHYKYNASDPAYLSATKKTPNHLLTWYAVEQACRWGYRLLDFGRSFKKSKGLLRYKESWGAVAEELAYWNFPGRRDSIRSAESPVLARMGMRLLNALPQRIVRTLEPFVFSRMG